MYKCNYIEKGTMHSMRLCCIVKQFCYYWNMGKVRHRFGGVSRFKGGLKGKRKGQQCNYRCNYIEVIIII